MVKMKHGIYSIINVTTGDQYIGSSAGRGFRNRFRTHEKGLEDNKHHSIYLQNSWNKHGKESFAFNILLYCDPENALFYEQLFMDYYQPKYNMSPTAGSCLGIKRRQSTKDKIGNIHRGKIIPEEVRVRMSITHKKDNSIQRMQTAEARKSAVDARLNSLLCRGVNKYNSKTNEKEVICIRNLYRSGLNYNQISKKYSHLNRRTVRDICLRKSWRHV